MERPEHNLRGPMGTTAGQLAPRRFGGLILVSAIHVGIVALLILGLVAGEVEKKKEDLQATVEQQKVEAKAPPPPPPDVVKPPPPFVPPPDFQIQTEAPPSNNAISTTQVRPPTPPPPAPPAAPPAPPAAPPVAAEPVMATHTPPPYPPISQRLGEHGTVLLNVTIDENGRATEATVATSSGSTRLDNASIDFVKQRYRWKPATQGGKAIATRQQIRIVYDLKDAQ
jgi:protein TonB